VKHGAGGVRAYVESPGAEMRARKELTDGGLLPDEIDAVVGWWRTDPRYLGEDTTVSRFLIGWSARTYALAERLAA
jgi:hypothetical protein